LQLDSISSTASDWLEKPAFCTIQVVVQYNTEWANIGFEKYLPAQLLENNLNVGRLPWSCVWNSLPI